jgi:hypothetical protein
MKIRGPSPDPVAIPAMFSYQTYATSMYVHPDGFEAAFGTIQGVRVSNDMGQ